MQRSGNSYKVRLALALLQCAVSCDRDRHPARRKPHAGFHGEIRADGAAAGSRGRTPPRRVQRHPLSLSAAARWRRTHGSSAPKRCSGCSLNSMRWSRTSAPPISGCRWSRAAATCRPALEDWMERGYAALQVTPQDPSIFCRGPAHRRRYRAVRLHPRRRPLRLRSGDLPGDPRTAAAGRADPGFRDDGLASRGRDRRDRPRCRRGFDRPAGAEAKTPTGVNKYRVRR